MFKLFSLPTLLLASLAIGVDVPEESENGCRVCTQQMPQCNNCTVSETCIIIPQSCFKCPEAVCLQLPFPEGGCVACNALWIPPCDCTVYETCIIHPQTCFKCAEAVCLPPHKSADDAKSSK